MKRTTKPKAKRVTKAAWARMVKAPIDPGFIKRKARKVTRSAKSGRFIDPGFSMIDPHGTVTETINPPVAVLKQILTEVTEIIEAEDLKPKTRLRRVYDRIMAAWHYVGG